MNERWAGNRPQRRDANSLIFSFYIDDELKLAFPEPYMAEELTAVVRENLPRLKPWMPWATDDYSVESCRQWIERSRVEFASDVRFTAIIFFQDKCAGTIGYHNLDLINRSAEIGYWIAREFEGRGIITRCCRAVIGHLFDTLELNRVQINCNVENVRSRRVPERLGFKLDGVLRQVEFLNDRFGDWAVYSMLRDEWRARSTAQ